MKKTVLKKFAKLIVRSGANVRRGQEVVINAGLDQPDFVTMVVEEAYKAGAKKVTVEWAHQPLTKIHVNNQSIETLSTLPEWQITKMKAQAENLPAMIHIISTDPDGLKGIDQAKMSESSKRIYPIIKPIRDSMENKHQWVIAAVPGVAWARKVFPALSKKRAVEALWNAILTSTRIDANPIKAWKLHNEDLQSRCDRLNEMNLDYLTYKSPNGTNFKVYMIPQAIWQGGRERTLKGVYFNPNLPSEEVFISPSKFKAEGKLVSTLPLSYRGELIEDFAITFVDGKVSEVTAKKNVELLRQMISMDEGAKMLGECALVPFESPIRKSGILFFNTLFDENAACHFALGFAFTNAIKNFEKYKHEDFVKMGVNESMIHVDFMVGSQDLEIIGTSRDGKKIPIFKKGNWAF